MKLAILSDIHDHVWNLRAALAAIRTHNADALLFCGDLNAPFVLGMLAQGFDGPIHTVAGNNEGDWRLIAAVAANANSKRAAEAQITLHGQFFTATIGGVRMAANHYPEIAREVAASGNYDLVCFGHNHQYELGRVGETVIVNPGTIMGFNPSNKLEAQDVPATFAIYDSADGKATVSFFRISAPWRSPNEPGEVEPFPLD